MQREWPVSPACDTDDGSAVNDSPEESPLAEDLYDIESDVLAVEHIVAVLDAVSTTIEPFTHW
jgi:hypothetical protein